MGQTDGAAIRLAMAFDAVNELGIKAFSLSSIFATSPTQTISFADHTPCRRSAARLHIVGDRQRGCFRLRTHDTIRLSMTSPITRSIRWWVVAKQNFGFSSDRMRQPDPFLGAGRDVGRIAIGVGFG